MSPDRMSHPANASRIISKVLSPALRFWLRSQVESIETLHLQIEGSDRQLLTGQVAKVSVAAQRAVYQGLHLTQIELVGEGIRVNLSQVLKGKPLKLLDAVPVQGTVCLHQADLNASWRSPLLAPVLPQFLRSDWCLQHLLPLLPADLQAIQHETTILLEVLAEMECDRLTLKTHWVTASGQPLTLMLRTGLKLASGHCLQLNQPEWISPAAPDAGFPLAPLHGYTLNLGSEVDLQDLQLAPEQLLCKGQIRVMP
ncbi:MAG: DUF2993 domain-containing protein [Oculatellaceae cyanobacterium Prado106]|jgi:hypothetical protein|nr:DUF2993 domain-containing protein [Oculatellaceae cyanobacterium Prado106]